MRTILIILSFFQLSSIYGQTAKAVEKSIMGSVVDRNSEKGIPFALIRSSENQFARSDDQGNFILPFKNDSNLIITGSAFDYYKDSVKFSTISNTKIFLKPMPIDAEDRLVITGNPIDTTYYQSGKIETISFQYHNRITYYESGKVKYKVVNGSRRSWFPNGKLEYQSLKISPHLYRITEWRKNGKIKGTWSESWRHNAKKNQGEWIKKRSKRPHR